MTPLDRERATYALLKERLQSVYGLGDDDNTLADTLEGETDLHGLLSRMVREARHREADAETCKAQIELLKTRKTRLEDGAEKIRKIVAETMLDMGIKKLAPGDFTASARLTASRPKVVDADQLPEWAVKIETKRVPDLAMIKEKAAFDGEAFSCPGVVITNGEPSLTVRT